MRIGGDIGGIIQSLWLNYGRTIERRWGTIESRHQSSDSQNPYYSSDAYSSCSIVPVSRSDLKSLRATKSILATTLLPGQGETARSGPMSGASWFVVSCGGRLSVAGFTELRKPQVERVWEPQTGGFAKDTDRRANCAFCAQLHLTSAKVRISRKPWPEWA